MSDGAVPKEFLFIDESGDPGLVGNPTYLLVCLHASEEAVDRIRRHLTTFRYHHDVVKEMKAQRWADKLSPVTERLLHFMADLTDGGDILSTATWLNKDKYRAGGGPYLAATGTTWLFRHYQLRRVLELHRARTSWSDATDLVIDRWRMSLEQRANLEGYLRGNFALRPVLASITMVDSAYCDPIQIVDIYGRLLRRVVSGAPSPDETGLAHRLMEIHEVVGGLF